MVFEYEIVFKKNIGFIPSLKKVRESSLYETKMYNAINLGKIIDKDYNMSKAVKEKVFIVSSFQEYVNGIFQVGLGTSNSCNVPIRDVISYLALIGATDFYMYHNHPSKKENPSNDDKMIMNQFGVIGNLIGCNFQGSYIITDKKIIKI